MTTQKDFKRVVRARMQKTGESYTAARHQLLQRPEPPRLGLSVKPKAVTQDAAQGPPAAARKGTADAFARLAGMSDASVKKATGCGWASWVRALDHAGAEQWPHRAIAEYVRDKYQTPGWWTQMVAVGYERIRGIRERGQQRGGEWRATKSRTVNAPLGRLYAAFATPKGRAGWLAGVRLTIRKATRNRSLRITWGDGTNVDIGFTAKGRSRSQVAIEHSKLATRAAAEATKAWWSERLDRLTEQVATQR